MTGVSHQPRPVRPIGSGWELALWLIAVLLGACALLLVPVARVHDPVLAVALTNSSDRVEFRQHTANLDALARSQGGDPERRVVDGLLDPWGRPLRWRPETSRFSRRSGRAMAAAWVACSLYSVGPNGLDEDGAGDDVDTLAGWSHPLRDWAPGILLFVPRFGIGFLALSLIACAGLTSRWARAPRSPSLRVEALRALLLVTWPASWGALWALGVRDADALLDRIGVTHRLWAPGGAAVSLSWALLWLLPALGWRLSRPRPVVD